MPGLKVPLPISFTDTSLPVLLDDAILTPGNGSLVLHDLAHSLTPADPSNPLPLTTAPSSGLVLPNIAYSKAAALLGGSPTRTSLASTLSIDGSPAASEFVMERSGKGGIHGIVSQTNNTVNGHGAQLNLPSSLATYLYTNQGHAYYTSLWCTFTRVVSGTGSSSQGEISDEASVAGRCITRFTQTSSTTGGQVGTGVTNLGTNYKSTAVATGPNYRSIAGSGYSSSTSQSAWKARAGLWGKDGGYNQQTSNIHPSWILYRYYLEDLTVSGRTFAAVDAIDYALYQAAFATGGKYNSDTYTAPAI